MRRLGCTFLAVILSLALVITPVMAKNGGGNSSGGGEGSSVSASKSSGKSSSAGNKASSVSPGKSGNKGAAKSGKSVSADNNSKSEKSNNKDKEKSNSGNKNGVVKNNADKKAENDKVKPTNQGQSKKESKVKADKKTKGGVDLTRGNKKAVQQRLQSKEAKTVKKQFKDAEGHWAKNCIQKVQQCGLIQGYEDGSFKPDAGISQVEAMVMVMNLAEIINDETDETNNTEDENTDEDQITDETDVDETTDEGDVDETIDENSEDDDSVIDEDENIADVPGWAKNQARKAGKMKVININRFHSHVQASRAQVAVMLAKGLELEPVEVDEEAFTDGIKISPEDVGYILALKEAGVVKGTPDGKFNPNSAITRAEMAAMLAQIVENVEDEEEEENDQSEEETILPDEDENDEGTDPIEDDDTLNDETESDPENTETEDQDDTADNSDA